MTESLRKLLPTLYGPRLPDFFDRPRVEEPRATCSDCAMCDKGHNPQTPGLRTGFFHPQIKCCTYHPTLPNYLVGAALADTSDALAVGRERLRKKLVARIGVTPGWLAAPRKQNVLFEAARDTSFGRAESLECPYYVREGGQCSIWPYRESICATFFCKHASGQAGRTFWMALKKYMIHVERTLARWAVTAVDPAVIEPDMPMNRLTQDDLEDRPPPATTYAAWWKTWVGREEDFYKECASRVQTLTADELTTLVGDDGRELLAEVTRLYQAVTEPRLAARLKLNPDMPVNPAADGSVAVIPYSKYDPLVLTQDLYLVLQQFSGAEEVSGVIARIFREHEVEVPEALVLSMQQFGVMVPVEADPPTP